MSNCKICKVPMLVVSKKEKLCTGCEEGQLYKIAEYIGEGLLWHRVPVQQYKEKWGGIRVYCDLGWRHVEDIIHPGGMRSVRLVGQWQLPTWLYLLSIRYHKWVYFRVYARATRLWPHKIEAIVNHADYPELLEDLIYGSP